MHPIKPKRPIRPTPEVIIIDSQLIVAADLAIQLTDLGYENFSIHNNLHRASYGLIKGRSYIGIVSMSLLKTMSGFECALKLQKDFQVNFILMSAHTDLVTVDRGLALQPHAFISKPFNLLEIKCAMKCAANDIQYATLQKWEDARKMRIVI